MARTRGSSSAFHQDDGILVDKDGKPIGVPGGIQHMDDGELVTAPAAVVTVAAPVAPVTGYVANAATWQRDMEAYELARMLDLAMGGALEVTLDPTEFARLPPDVKRHFRGVRG